MHLTTSCKRNALLNCRDCTHRDGTFRLRSRGRSDMRRKFSLMKLPLKLKRMHVEARSVLFFFSHENNHWKWSPSLQTPVDRSDGYKCSGVEEILEHGLHHSLVRQHNRAIWNGLFRRQVPRDVTKLCWPRQQVWLITILIWGNTVGQDVGLDWRHACHRVHKGRTLQASITDWQTGMSPLRFW